MSHATANRSRWFIFLLALMPGFLIATPYEASAIVNGSTVSEAPPWIAYITAPQGSCTGALVAPQWVLTAAHCVADLDDNDNDYSVSAANKVKVEIGRISQTARGNSVKVTNIETRRYRRLPIEPSNEYLDDDVALLRLEKPVEAEILWMLPSAGLAEAGTELNLYGYGHDVSKADREADKKVAARSKSGTLRLTNPDPPNRLQYCFEHGVVCAIQDKFDGSFSETGDSGGPWTMMVDGYPILAFVHSMSYPASEGASFAWVGSGESVFNDMTRDWLRGHLGIPQAGPGTIVRDPATAESWLIDSEGFRRHIPDGGTYECLVARGSAVQNLYREGIDLIPQRSLDATCTHDGGDVLLFAFDTEHEDEVVVAEALEALGYGVTVSGSLPEDLSGFAQVWAFTTYSAFPSEVASGLSSYVKSGGSLYLNSEHSCCYTANESVESLLNEVLAAGDVSVVTDCALCVRGAPNPFNSEAKDNIASHPNRDVVLYTDAQGWYENVSGSNVLMTASDRVTGAVWSGSDLVGGTGRVVAIADSNWTDSGRFEEFGNLPALENIAAFLASRN